MDREIGALTGLRGVAALWVLACHAAIFTPRAGSWMDEWIRPIAYAGFLGVDVFFILSGFVLAYAYERDAVRTGRAYVHFLRKRLARIYPLHVFSLAFLAASTALLGFAGVKSGATRLLDTEALVPTLLLTHAWTLKIWPLWNPPSWSISCEWAAYLAFPAIAFLIARLRSAAQAGRVVVYLALGLAFFYFISGSTLTDATDGLARIAFEFPMGVALYRLRSMSKRPGNSDAYATVALALLIAGAAIYEEGKPAVPAIAFFPGIAAALIYFLACADGFAHRALASRGMRYLGRISFAIYLMHFPMLLIAGALIRHWGLWDAASLIVLATCVLTLGVSALVYHFVEIPCRRLILPRSGNVPVGASATPSAQTTAAGP